MIRNHKHRFVAKSQTLALHGGSDHLEGLARAHFVRQQRIASVKDVCDSIQLMLPQMNLRVHTAESDMGAIVFARPVGIEQLIVPRHKLLPSVRVFPYPLGKGVLDGLLFLLGKGCFFGIENPALLAVRVGHGVIDAHIPQVQRVLQNPVGVCTLRAVGHIGVYIVVGRLGFSADAPLRSER